MPALINNKEDRLTVAQQKEIVQRCNDAYDKGGADALKIVVDTALGVQEKYGEDVTEFVKFTLHLVEVVRQSLQSAVETAESDCPIEENKIITV